MMSRLFRSSQCHETPTWGEEGPKPTSPDPPRAVPRRDGFKEGKSLTTDVLDKHTPSRTAIRQPSIIIRRGALLVELCFWSPHGEVFVEKKSGGERWS